MNLDITLTDLLRIKNMIEYRMEMIQEYLKTWAAPEKDPELNTLYFNELLSIRDLYDKMKEAIDKY